MKHLRPLIIVILLLPIIPANFGANITNPLPQLISQQTIISISNEADLAAAGFPGDGSNANPYVITGQNISSVENQISISNTLSYIIIEDNVLSFVDNGGLSLRYGIKLINTSNILIRNNAIYNNSYYGIKLFSGSNVNITSNIIDNNFVGIQISGTLNIVNNNTISRGDRGIYLDGTSNKVFNNYIYNTTGVGIYFSTSFKDSVYNNLVENAGSDGMYFGGSEVHIFNNSIINNKKNGIGFQTGTNSAYKNYIHNNNISNNAKSGLDLFNSGGVQISENWIFGNGLDGISLSSFSSSSSTYYTKRNSVYNNKILNNSRYGITMGNSIENDIWSNTISNQTLQGIAILTGVGEYNRIFYNNITKNNRLNPSNQSVIAVNTTNISMNYWGGLGLANADNDEFYDTAYIVNNIEIDDRPLVDPMTKNTPLLTNPILVNVDDKLISTVKLKWMPALDSQFQPISYDLSLISTLSNISQTLATNLTEPEFTFNSFFYDDGYYYLNITASNSENYTSSATFLILIWNRQIIMQSITSPSRNQVIDDSLTITWNAAKDSVNASEVIIYDLYYGVDKFFNSWWILIAANFTATSYNWNSSSIVDGDYNIKLVGRNRFGDTGTIISDDFTITHQVSTTTTTTSTTTTSTSPTSTTPTSKTPTSQTSSSETSPPKDTSVTNTDSKETPFSLLGFVMALSTMMLLQIWRKKETFRI